MTVLDRDFSGLISMEPAPFPAEVSAEEDADLRVTLIRLASPPAREAIAAATGWLPDDAQRDTSVVSADLSALARELRQEWRRLKSRASGATS